jgi:Pyruvate/2-oxoacid:ferredoxin oxidoreductase delta subunit
VSLKDGKRNVTTGMFQQFCAHMHLSKEQADRISYVYCPDPALADNAKVTFEAGVGIDEYTVWYVNTDFSS